MPEMPQVQALVDFLDVRLVHRVAPDGEVLDGGAHVTGVTLGSFAVLKTAVPPLDAIAGAEITGVARFGKYVDLDCDGVHLVFHLARAGWLRWLAHPPARPLRPGGKGPVALRLEVDGASDGGTGFELTEAGTKKSLAVYVVSDPTDVPGLATLGPEALTLSADDFARLLTDHRGQIKGLLRDQSVIAGIGNAYSDEILHAAKLSPFAIAAKLSNEEVGRLYTAMRTTLDAAIAASAGKPAAELKDSKRSSMAVHGRTGEACPVCGDIVQEVSFADSSLQYCPTCQTGGKPLADRRTSRFLK
ncbi:endonuclease VIII [Tersicoccus phoenicis]|uniref:Endonuclease VIII n=1 Tax=Tersicoccus phoenicis TaxID=554083 RepID=A0A1R1LBC8_9MICC|nr:DNA-formamidopyrimidine glycosylase family protein [Tersicoccus phoenicis]OMH24837.1 endonuclease VIII [Tersicoccus phoenicis]